MRDYSVDLVKDSCGFFAFFDGYACVLRFSDSCMKFIFRSGGRAEILACHKGVGLILTLTKFLAARDCITFTHSYAFCSNNNDGGKLS